MNSFFKLTGHVTVATARVAGLLALTTEATTATTVAAVEAAATVRVTTLGAVTGNVTELAAL